VGRRRWRFWVLLVAGLVAAGALAADAGAHVDGCHRWHSCPSHDGRYVCGDRGHCSECPDNQYCLLGQPRGAAPTATRTPRPTRTPEPTASPRPTRTPDAVRAARESDATSAGRGEPAADGAAAGGARPSGRGLAGPGAAGAAFGGLPAAGATALATPSPVPLPELQGVRLVQPPRWTLESEGAAAELVLTNGTDAPRTVVVVVSLHDGDGEQMAAVQAIVADLGAGETRSIVQSLPPLATPPSELRVRLEPLVP